MKRKTQANLEAEKHKKKGLINIYLKREKYQKKGQQIYFNQREIQQKRLSGQKL